MLYYRFLLYIIFGILPSLVWLFYYLKKDLHPEPKKMIVKIFIFGGFMTLPVFFVQLSLMQWLTQIQGLAFLASYPILVEIIKWFFVIALTEETFKFLVVKLAVFGRKELDEPVDLMIYMIVAALGFAAVENMLYLFSPIDGTFSVVLETTLTISFIRFIGGTFLHTLCSGLLGYFIALSCVKRKKRLGKLFLGLLLAMLLHGLYNFSIMELPSPLNIQIPIIIMAVLAIGVLLAFNRVKNMKSVCKI